MFLNMFMKNYPNLSKKINNQYKFYKINSISYNILVIYSYKINNINYILYYDIITTNFFGSSMSRAFVWYITRQTYVESKF